MNINTRVGQTSTIQSTHQTQSTDETQSTQSTGRLQTADGTSIEVVLLEKTPSGFDSEVSAQVQSPVCEPQEQTTFQAKADDGIKNEVRIYETVGRRTGLGVESDLINTLHPNSLEEGVQKENYFIKNHGEEAPDMVDPNKLRMQKEQQDEVKKQTSGVSVSSRRSLFEAGMISQNDLIAIKKENNEKQVPQGIYKVDMQGPKLDSIAEEDESQAIEGNEVETQAEVAQMPESSHIDGKSDVLSNADGGRNDVGETAVKNPIQRSPSVKDRVKLFESKDKPIEKEILQGTAKNGNKQIPEPDAGAIQGQSAGVEAGIVQHSVVESVPIQQAQYASEVLSPLQSGPIQASVVVDHVPTEVAHSEPYTTAKAEYAEVMYDESGQEVVLPNAENEISMKMQEIERGNTSVVESIFTSSIKDNFFLRQDRGENNANNAPRQQRGQRLNIDDDHRAKLEGLFAKPRQVEPDEVDGLPRKPVESKVPEMPSIPQSVINNNSVGGNTNNININIPDFVSPLAGILDKVLSARPIETPAPAPSTPEPAMPAPQLTPQAPVEEAKPEEAPADAGEKQLLDKFPEHKDDIKEIKKDLIYTNLWTHVVNAGLSVSGGRTVDFGNLIKFVKDTINEAREEIIQEKATGKTVVSTSVVTEPDGADSTEEVRFLKANLKNMLKQQLSTQMETENTGEQESVPERPTAPPPPPLFERGEDAMKRTQE